MKLGDWKSNIYDCRSWGFAETLPVGQVEHEYCDAIMSLCAVSYTHLDVYKRQNTHNTGSNWENLFYISLSN